MMEKLNQSKGKRKITIEISGAEITETEDDLVISIPLENWKIIE